MTLILVCIILVLILICLKPRKRLPNEPPLVAGHWFFGNALEFSKDAVGFLLKNQKLHGDIFTLRLINRHLTIIMDPHFYEEIGKHKSLSFDPIQRQVNRNVFGFEVRDTKTLLKEAGITMKGKQQATSLRTYVDNLEISVKKLKSSTTMNELGLRPLVVSTLFSAIFTSIFGESNDKQFNSGLVHNYFESFHKYFNFLWMGMPIWWFPEAKRALLNLHKMPSAESLLSRKDLSAYLKIALRRLLDQNQTEAEIRGHNLVYLHVNYNTFRLAYWALYFILKNNEARTSIMGELRNTLGNLEEGDIDLSEELINRMHHLESVVQETCRLSSGVFVVRHVINTSAIHLSDDRSYVLRVGDDIAIFPPSIHKDPTIFDLPKNFKHDRFLGKKFFRSGRQILSPIMSFGTLCPGKKYSLLQLKIFIIFMLIRFDINLKGDQELNFDEAFSGHEVLPPDGDVDVYLSPRNLQHTITFSDSLKD